MKLIAAVDKNWGIGYQNRLLASIPADQRYFRELTSGNAVLMGRNTFEGLPGGLPLPERVNLVMTSRADYDTKGAVAVHSVEEALAVLESFNGLETYVIGGGSVYQQLLPFCDTAYITKINFTYQADAYAPNLDQDREWKVTGISEEQTFYDLEYYFYRYERILKKPNNHGG